MPSKGEPAKSVLMDSIPILATNRDTVRDTSAVTPNSSSISPYMQKSLSASSFRAVVSVLNADMSAIPSYDLIPELARTHISLGPVVVEITGFSSVSPVSLA